MGFMDKWIRNVEKDGQNAVSYGLRLPKYSNPFCGEVWKFRAMSESERQGVSVEEFNQQYTKDKYESLGIRIVQDFDDLFYCVVLPDGWKIVPDGSSVYWSELHDDSGKSVGDIFYKAVSYDRDAFINFEEE